MGGGGHASKMPAKTKEDGRSCIDILRVCGQDGRVYLVLIPSGLLFLLTGRQFVLKTYSRMPLFVSPSPKQVFLFSDHVVFDDWSSRVWKRARRETTGGELRGQSTQEYSRLRFNIKQFAGPLPSFCPSNSIHPLIDRHGNRAYSQDKAAVAEKRIT